MKDYSDPAFPIVGACADNQFNGMSLRDYFATRAMQALLSKPIETGADALAIPRVAYQVADAMLVERAK